MSRKAIRFISDGGRSRSFTKPIALMNLATKSNFHKIKEFCSNRRRPGHHFSHSSTD